MFSPQWFSHNGAFQREEVPDEDRRVWVITHAGGQTEERAFTDEENAILDTEAQQAAEEDAALRALSQPTIDEIDQLFRTRGLTALGAAEKANLEDRLVYLSSRGKHGKAS